MHCSVSVCLLRTFFLSISVYLGVKTGEFDTRRYIILALPLLIILKIPEGIFTQK